MSKATEKMDVSLNHIAKNDLKQVWIAETEEKMEDEQYSLPQKGSCSVKMANYSFTSNAY